MSGKGYEWYNSDNVIWRATHYLCHATPVRAIDGKPERKNHYNTDKRNEEAQICLNCTKERCSGAEKCFARRKEITKEMTEETKNGET